MRKVIKCSSTNSKLLDHIKVELFDYLADNYLDIDGSPADNVVETLEELAPTITVDDVLWYASLEGITLVESLEKIEALENRIQALAPEYSMSDILKICDEEGYELEEAVEALENTLTSWS